MKILLSALLLLIISSNILFCQGLQNKELPKTRILFIFDASQSMEGQFQKSKKINIARDVLIEMIDSLEKLDNVQMALRVYGHQSIVPPQDCSDTRLEVPFSPKNAGIIRQRLRNISPKGTTPIANSLEQSERDFSKCANCRNIIILITDGIEACNGDPCAVTEALQKKGIVLKPFVIGIGIDEDFKQTFNCIGNYYNTKDEEKFREVFNVIIKQALNQTSAQVNLLDSKGLPTETNVNMTFYDKYSGKVKLNYIHTMNHRGYPDTLMLDPLITYRIQVHTIPPVFIDSARVIPGKHATFAVDAPQGYLLIKEIGGNLYRDTKVIVRKQKELKTLNYQDLSYTEKYITGRYDLEIPILPPLLVENVEVKQSHTTTVEIPRPGIATLMMASVGYGSIYVNQNNSLKWIKNIPNDTRNFPLILQPGEYTVVWRAQNAKQTFYSVTRTFEIQSGVSIPVELY